MTPRERYARKQIAIRRLLLDGKGHLNRDARLLVADMRRFCRADGSPTIAFSPQSGMIDPIASVAAAARREVFDRYMRLLGIDETEILNTREEP